MFRPFSRTLFVRHIRHIPHARAVSSITSMNRPRNRQPRPNQHQNSQGQDHNRHRNNKFPGHVPDISKVLPGAWVSIVLKADQPTGREVQGVVQDILTRGNHPRGIKVRLKDGRVGRVQRMIGNGEAVAGSGDRWPASVPTSPVTGGDATGQRQWGDHGEDSGLPPSRSLADFIPTPNDESSAKPALPEEVTFLSAEIECPFCSAFEGDEAAVSYHVETTHLD